MHTCSTSSVNMHVVLELSSLNFLSVFFYFFNLDFSRSISIRIDILWAQLLDFSTNHLETMHTCSTWSEDLHVVLGLSCPYLFSTFLLFGFILPLSFFKFLWFLVGRPCVSVHPSVHFHFQMITSKHQWIFTRLGMCFDIVEIWFGIANGQISSNF